ncbi:MAG TPA: CHASE4 domain-containing protein [Patescibacteria group bacterium]|nr:CHASE4 domain-containing protein [Patescibacteria group bacterium]
MNLRKKTLCLVSLAFLIMILTVALLARELLLEKFARMEQDNVRENTFRAVAALQANMQDLGNMSMDYAAWNDTRDFMDSPNQEYIDANIDSAMPNFRLNLLLMLDRNGKLVFGRGWDLEEKKEVNITDDWKKYAYERSPLLRNGEDREPASALLCLGDMPALAGYYPIVANDKSGLSRGTLVMVRYLEPAMLKDLSRTIYLPVRLAQPDDLDGPDSLSRITREPTVNVVGANEIAGYVRVPDLLGSEAAIIRVQLPRNIYNEGMQSVLYLLMSLVAIGLLYIPIALFLLDRLALQKLQRLMADILSISSAQRWAARVRGESGDEIGLLARAINHMLAMLEFSLGKLRDSNEAMENLLNNAGQGFLTLGRNLQVQTQYSMECERLFGGEISGRKFSELIYPGEENKENRQFVDRALTMVAENGADKVRRRIILELLPQEVPLGSTTIGIGYRWVGHTRSQEEFGPLMVVLTDIGHTRQLEKQLEQEKAVLKMAVKAAMDPQGLRDALEGYQTFCREEIAEILSGAESAVDASSRILSSLHSYKGLFGQLEMTHTVQQLHEAETALLQQRTESGDNNKEALGVVAAGLELSRLPQRDVETLQNIYGEGFFHRQEYAMVPLAKLRAVEQQATGLPPGETTEALLLELRRLNHRPFRDLLRHYPEYTRSLAERLHKPFAGLEIEGGEFLVDLSLYRGLTKVLLHIIRNALDHGLETEQERQQAGKPETGRIYCRIEWHNNEIILYIGDDGRGINMQELRQTALEGGFCSASELAVMDEAALTGLLFRERFSTRKESSLLSGRGLGLSAVQREVGRLRGRVFIHNRPGRGTEFEIRLPG